MNTSSKLNPLVIIGVFVLVFGLWIGSYIFIEYKFAVVTATLDNGAMRGQFGDQFGAVNALFSGLAFAGIIITLLLQREDLIATRSAMGIDRFDNTFFQLIKVQESIVGKLDLAGYKGREAISAFNEKLFRADPEFYTYIALRKLTDDQVSQIIDDGVVDRDLYSALSEADVGNLQQSRTNGTSAYFNFLHGLKDNHKARLKAACEKHNAEHLDKLAHYFRSLYHILKFVDESTLISTEERKRYARFLRAQLSQDELLAIFYNSILKIDIPGRGDLEMGYNKMGKLIMKYDMLHNMNRTNLIHKSHDDIFKDSYLK